MSYLQSNLQGEINKLDQDSAFIELFVLDARPCGGNIYYLTNNPAPTGGAIFFGGQAYQPIPIQATGFDSTSSGTLPKPAIIISNVHQLLLDAVRNLGDLVGAKFIRLRTYEKFLDTGATPNNGAYIGPEEWIVEQMTERNAHAISWSLTTQIDRVSYKTGRQVLKDPSPVDADGHEKNLYAPGVSRNRITA